MTYSLSDPYRNQHDRAFLAEATQRWRETLCKPLPWPKKERKNVIHGPWPLPSASLDEDRRFFEASPQRTYRLRYASQIECALYCEGRNILHIPNDMFLYAAMRGDRDGCILKFRLGLWSGVIIDSEEIGRKVLEWGFEATNHN